MAKPDQLDEAFAALCELYDKTPSVALVAMYREALLSKLSVHEAVSAIKLAFASKTYGFPKPGDILELYQGSAGDAAIKAWTLLDHAIRSIGHCQSVKFCDPKITTAIEALGGWERVCATPEREIKFLRKDFEAIYRGLKESGDARTLPGLYERQNAALGFHRHIPRPVTVGHELLSRNLIPGDIPLAIVRRDGDAA